MKLSRIVAAIVEGTFDLLLAIPLIVIASMHRWLDATLTTRGQVRIER
jgi:hypothetical protein